MDKFFPSLPIACSRWPEPDRTGIESLLPPDLGLPRRSLPPLGDFLTTRSPTFGPRQKAIGGAWFGLHTRGTPAYNDGERSPEAGGALSWVGDVGMFDTGGHGAVQWMMKTCLLLIVYDRKRRCYARGLMCVHRNGLYGFGPWIPRTH